MNNLLFAAKLYKVFANENRLRIANLMLHFDVINTSYVSEVTGMTQSMIARYLNYFDQTRLTGQFREGQWQGHFLLPEFRELIKAHIEFWDCQILSDDVAKYAAHTSKKVNNN